MTLKKRFFSNKNYFNLVKKNAFYKIFSTSWVTSRVPKTGTIYKCKPAVLKLQFYAFLLLEHTHVFLFISTCMCKEVRPAIYISVFLLLFHYYSFLKNLTCVFSLSRFINCYYFSLSNSLFSCFLYIIYSTGYIRINQIFSVILFTQ